MKVLLTGSSPSDIGEEIVRRDAKVLNMDPSMADDFIKINLVVVLKVCKGGVSRNTSVSYYFEDPHIVGGDGYEFLPDHRIQMSKMLEIFGFPENKKLYRKSYRDIPTYSYNVVVRSTMDYITSWAMNVVQAERTGGWDKRNAQKIIAGEDNLRLFWSTYVLMSTGISQRDIKRSVMKKTQ